MRQNAISKCFVTSTRTRTYITTPRGEPPKAVRLSSHQTTNEVRMLKIAKVLSIPDRGPARQVVLSGFSLNIGTGLQEIILPFFLLRFCGASIGEVGIVLTVVAVSALFAVLPAGYLCDKLPAARMIVVAGVTQAAATLALILTSSIVVVACILTLCTVMAQISRIARATIVVSLRPETRTVVRAQMSVWSNLGVGIGMALTVIFLGFGERVAYNSAFAITAVCFLASAILRSTLLSEGRTLDAGKSESTLQTALMALKNPKQSVIALLHGAVFLHQIVLTIGVSLWVATDEELPDWLAGLTLVLNLIIAVALQSPVARRVITPGDAIGAWSLSAATAGVAMAIFGLGVAGSWPSYVAVTLVLAGIVVLSLAELWYVAGELEMSILHANEDSQGTSQAVFLLGRDLGTVVGPLLLAALIVSRDWLPWAGAVTVFVLIALLLQRMKQKWAKSVDLAASLNSA
ncbi:MFS transporter [Rathayibacter rathayi]|uniref:MFS transporter n=2 Tax=Rathayibacter rathayi TaxID=33887 RepID=UPI0011B0432F